MNKYEIVETLGQGGYGRANLVRRKSDKKLFVEKEVRLASMSQKDRDGAIQEAKLLASLKYPYIVEYEESFQEKGYLYIVMEYADGGDLAKKIESRGNKLFTEEEILHDFIEISLAIKYIHDRKICHRDLKGQNIFLTKDGTIKLGDFGISKVLESTFQGCQTQIGTPFYLSPEICNGQEYNTKTDIWSLGCILYELCTLKHAFSGNNIQVLMVNIIQARYSPIPSHYSQDLRSLVDKMLTKEPEKRPSINQILNVPYIKKRLGNFLDKELLEYEMGHTRLHNRKPFAAPTIIVSKEQPPKQSKPQQPSIDKSFDELEEKKKQLQLKEAILDKKEAEIAAREQARKKMNEEEIRARQYYEQKQAALDNKARMQKEMSGDNMKYALQYQYPKSNNDIYGDDHKYQYDEGGYEDQARENYLEQLRMARANRERMKREELQGTEMQLALMDAQYEDENYDNYYRKNKRKAASDNNFDELNAYMRQQRREAAANKKRLEEAMRGSAAKAALSQQDEEKGKTKGHNNHRKSFNEKTCRYEYNSDYYSDYYSDYSEPQSPIKKNQKLESVDVESRNEYMRQLRHEREANRLRAQEYERRAKDEEKKKQNGSTSSSNAKQDSYDLDGMLLQKKNKDKKDEMSPDERNVYMREQRRKRRENKEKIEAMGQINMDQIIADAEKEQNLSPRKGKESSAQVAVKSKKSKNEVKSSPKNKNENENEIKDENKGNNDKEENHDNEQSKCCLLI